MAFASIQELVSRAPVSTYTSGAPGTFAVSEGDPVRLDSAQAKASASVKQSRRRRSSAARCALLVGCSLAILRLKIGSCPRRPTTSMALERRASSGGSAFRTLATQQSGSKGESVASAGNSPARSEAIEDGMEFSARPAPTHERPLAPTKPVWGYVVV